MKKLSYAIAANTGTPQEVAFAPAIYTVQHIQSGRIRNFGPVTGGWAEVESMMNAQGLYPLDWALTQIEEV